MKPTCRSLYVAAIIISGIFFLIGCTAFQHGYTWSKAQNAYYLVTTDENNFGNKRLSYNKGFHRNSELANFLNCSCNLRGQPAFIYEYMSDSKTRGIKLFYPKIDSVFVFEEPGKNQLRSVLKEARSMDDYERMTFERLISQPGRR